MVRQGRRRWGWAVGLLLLGGCTFPVREQVDAVLCDRALRPLDLAPASVTDPSPGPAPAEERALPSPAPGPHSLIERLQIPSVLPGADAPPLKLPPRDPANQRERDAVVGRLFPALPPLGENPPFQPGPEGRPLALADLQRLAAANAPALRQAAAAVEAARGAAVQAGLPPNPTVGYEGDSIGTGPGAGYQGGFASQTIRTAGKLHLAQASASLDLRSAELAFRRAETDLAAQVRGGYFAVLVARENVRVSLALARLTEEAYRVQVEMVQRGQAAAYEPLQSRVLALQARGTLVQARNRTTAAWKQLAASLGLPGLPPTALAGRVDRAIPVYQYDALLARVLAGHTDVQTAAASLQKARYDLRLAQVRPVPDVDVRVMVQKDYTTVPFHVTPSVAVSVPFPVWDRNQGGIRQAEANLLRAVEEAHRVRSDLSGRLADAFERYLDNRQLLEYYRTILPDQVQTYRGVFERFQQEPEKINLGDVVVAQQTLTGSLATYITTLGGLWQAVVDVASLLQTDDLFQADAEECHVPLLELDQLAPLPCAHPCPPLTDPALRAGDGSWPAAIGEAAKRE